ncbi:hypothetical protein HYU21_04145 [Candidatus Woesearchaeota archaeon]|nr:hypothetical protein [Candidatus Woesearchaeota archaeon]
MVAAKEKNRAIDFTAKMLENSTLYLIQKQLSASLVISERKEIVEHPKTIEVIMANFLPTAEAFSNRYQENNLRDYRTAALLYKDEKSAFVRMVEKNRSWRTEKSLKKYTPQEINQMLSLRKIEKDMLNIYNTDCLVYYQSLTDNLEESLRKFRMGDVQLDYSHIGPNDPGYGFVQNRKSIDYKIPEEHSMTDSKAEILFSERNKARWKLG